MPDHLGPQELLRYQCSCGLFSVQKWGGGNFSRPRGPYIKRWQELSDTLSLHRNSCHLPPPSHHRCSRVAHLFPSLTTTPI